MPSHSCRAGSSCRVSATEPAPGARVVIAEGYPERSVERRDRRVVVVRCILIERNGRGGVGGGGKAKAGNEQGGQQHASFHQRGILRWVSCDIGSLSKSSASRSGECERHAPGTSQEPPGHARNSPIGLNKHHKCPGQDSPLQRRRVPLPPQIEGPEARLAHRYAPKKTRPQPGFRCCIRGA